MTFGIFILIQIFAKRSMEFARMGITITGAIYLKNALINFAGKEFVFIFFFTACLKNRTVIEMVTIDRTETTINTEC